MTEETSGCVDKVLFYEQLELLKASKKGKSSNLTVFINDEFYDRAKAWLIASDSKESEGLSRQDVATIKRKKWSLHHGRIVNENGKYVVPKRDIYKTLSDAHSAIAHRGRDKTERYIRESFSEVSQDVVTLFVSLCKLHQEQKSVTNHLKKPIIKPILASGFLSHVEIDLIDFRNLLCACTRSHKWVLHVVDHYSKFSWLYPLYSKENEQVIQVLHQQFYLFGFPSTLHSDNGGEFKSKKMSEFCKVNNIKQAHGAPRTPTTQGLVERNNRTVKENMNNILKEKQQPMNKWCTILNEAAYKKNIANHIAIDKTPYEAVFGMLPRREVHPAGTVITVDSSKEENPAVLDSKGTNKRKHEDEEDAQRKKLQRDITEKQTNYNTRMKQRRKQAAFSPDDHVSIKIDKVDKTSPLHPNVLIGKIITVENDYAKIVTKFGRVNTYISTNRLNKCTATNINFDYSKEIAFSAACKKAAEQ